MRARAKQARAVRLFTKGWTYEQIAEKVGFANRGTAYKVVKKALDEQIVEDIELHRQMHYDALNLVLVECWKVIDDENAEVGQQIRAAATAADIIGKKIKLLGLDCHKCDFAPQMLVVPKATQERQHSCCEHCPERKEAA